VVSTPVQAVLWVWQPAILTDTFSCFLSVTAGKCWDIRSYWWLKTHHGHSATHSFQFLIHNHPSIRLYTVSFVGKVSLNNPRIENYSSGMLRRAVDRSLPTFQRCLLPPSSWSWRQQALVSFYQTVWSIRCRKNVKYHQPKINQSINHVVWILLSFVTDNPSIPSC
jgi:hypothetical protein